MLSPRLRKCFYIKVFNNMVRVQSWTALFRAFSSHRQPSAISALSYPVEVDMASQESTTKDVKMLQYGTGTVRWYGTLQKRN